MDSFFKEWNRRTFLSAIMATGMSLSFSRRSFAQSPGNTMATTKPIRIKTAVSNFEREPLKRPFGFKGNYMSEKWQTAVLLETESGHQGLGLCSPSVLWADASVFTSRSEGAGNALLYSILDYAVQQVQGMTFSHPIELLQNVLSPAYEYGKKITENPHLRETFVLMALVALDNAAWLVYAKEHGMQTFDEMIPRQYQKGLSHHHTQVASIPLFSYTVPIDEVIETVNQGYFFLKIKIGQPGTQQEMLEKDQARLQQIHRAIGHIETPHTANNKLIYYLDANGRYESKESVLKLLDHAQKIGARDQIIMIEEPLPEHQHTDISDMGVKIIADESAHTDRSAQERIDMGYHGFAIKAAAKTLSMSLRIIDLAHKHNLDCFCADSTANPILVEWNKNVAARLKPIPGLNMGLVETNGRQNYAYWDEMMSYHPMPNASWVKANKGVFDLDESFYRTSGGIFKPSPHYMNLFKSYLK